MLAALLLTLTAAAGGVYDTFEDLEAELSGPDEVAAGETFEVDAWGQPVYAGDDSALYALLRMLSSADDELVCTIEVDILPGDWGSLELFEVTIDNLAETLLGLIATRSTDEIVGGVDFLGEALGLGLTEDVLYAVADAGTCDLIDRQMVDDLAWIEAVPRELDEASRDVRRVDVEVQLRPSLRKMHCQRPDLRPD